MGKRVQAVKPHQTLFYRAYHTSANCHRAVEAYNAAQNKYRRARTRQNYKAWESATRHARAVCTKRIHLGGR